MTILAPGITAPSGSRILPNKVAVDCAEAQAAKTEIETNQTAMKETLFRLPTCNHSPFGYSFAVTGHLVCFRVLKALDHNKASGEALAKRVRKATALPVLIHIRSSSMHRNAYGIS